MKKNDDARRIADAVIAVCRTIASAETEPSLDALAREAGMSRFHFHRVFKAATGVTPKDYARECRAGRLRSVLPDAVTVTEAVYAAGFGSGGRFYAEARDTLGMAPKRFREGAPGETIRFAVAKASLGSVLVAATAKGVCAIALGDDPDVLTRELQDRFPKAEFVGADSDFEKLVARVVGLIESPKTPVALPLDIRGTAFQRRVWTALGKIPAGETMTYAEVAEAIGSPKSVRAVAGACAANALAVVVPCHRVVRTDGSLSGYRWGVPRKRELLDRESAG